MNMEFQAHPCRTRPSFPVELLLVRLEMGIYDSTTPKQTLQKNCKRKKSIIKNKRWEKYI